MRCYKKMQYVLSLSNIGDFWSFHGILKCSSARHMAQFNLKSYNLYAWWKFFLSEQFFENWFNYSMQISALLYSYYIIEIKKI